ncbi:MAG: hypothetical protein ABI699_05955 [Caldimonas sp.]
MKAARQSVRTAGEAELRKLVRACEQLLQAIRAGDCFPGKAGAGAARGLAMLRTEVERKLSPGGPIRATGQYAALWLAE